MTALPGIVVVTYWAEHCIATCLDALEASMPPGSHVVIVDNASADGTTELVEGWVGDGGRKLTVELFASDCNLGFGAACNLAVRKLQDQWSQSESGDLDRWVVLVNPDVVVQAFNASALDSVASSAPVGALALAQRDSQNEAAYPRLRAFPGMLESAMGFSLALLVPAALRAERLFWRVPCATCRRDRWASGGFLAVRHRAWTAIGGFDERYFLFWEDVDLSRRLLTAGWRVEPSDLALGLHAAEPPAGERRGVDLWKLTWGLAGWLTYLRIWGGRRAARRAAALTLAAQMTAIAAMWPLALPQNAVGAPFRRKSREVASLARLVMNGFSHAKYPAPDGLREPAEAIRRALE